MLDVVDPEKKKKLDDITEPADIWRDDGANDVDDDDEVSEMEKGTKMAYSYFLAYSIIYYYICYINEIYIAPYGCNFRSARHVRATFSGLLLEMRWPGFEPTAY